MGTTYRDLEEYVALVTSGRKTFIAKNPHPFLVRLPEQIPDNIDPWGDDEFSYATRVPGMAVDDDDDLPAHAVIIMPVRKRPGGPFPLRIGIGRARNCDLVLRFSSVSKLHAQFHIEKDPLSIVDLESANGTFVDGVRLAPRVVQPVPLGTKLQFGVVAVELIDAATLFDRLEAKKR